MLAERFDPPVWPRGPPAGGRALTAIQDRHALEQTENVATSMLRTSPRGVGMPAASRPAAMSRTGRTLALTVPQSE
jgi:hypothetical protein